MNKTVVILALITFMLPTPGYALCSPGKPDLNQEYAESNYVVTATPILKQTIMDQEDPTFVSGEEYTVKIGRIYKGSPDTTVVLFSENTSARFPMDMNKPYLLFIQTSHDENYVDNCGLSMPVSEARDYLSQLNQILANPK